MSPFKVVEIEHIDRVEASYRRLHPRLWHALYAYAGDHEIATEAEAEAFAQVLRRGSDVRNVDAWTWRSAFRIAGGLLSKRSRYEATWGHGRDQANSAHQSVDNDALVEFIDQLSTLSDQQRAVVVLRYVGLFTPAEIADLLHTSSGTVRVQLHRAHERLRLSMERTHE